MDLIVSTLSVFQMVGVPSVLQGVDPAIVSAITAGFGAVLIKVIERWVSKRSTSLQKEETNYRQELKDDLADTKEQLGRSEEESHSWMEKYYNLYEINRQNEIKLRQLHFFIEDRTKNCKLCKTQYKKFSEDLDDDREPQPSRKTD